MSKHNRELATAENFVWIPTGHDFDGTPDGIVGYWDGTKRKDNGGIERAEIEFLGDDGFNYCLVNLGALYLATDSEIEAQMDDDEVSSWRNYLIEREK